jgi:hypothetical protein
MARSNIRRIPFILNLDDPGDAAIWEALEPLLTRHRASQFIRGAVAQALGLGGGSLLIEPRAAPALPPPRTSRSFPPVTVEASRRAIPARWSGRPATS